MTSRRYVFNLYKYSCMYMDMKKYLFISTCVHMDMNKNLFIYTYMHMDMNKYLFISTCIHMDMKKYLFISTCMHIDIINILFIFTCIHINMNKILSIFTCTHINKKSYVLHTSWGHEQMKTIAERPARKRDAMTRKALITSWHDSRPTRCRRRLRTEQMPPPDLPWKALQQ